MAYDNPQETSLKISRQSDKRGIHPMICRFTSLLCEQGNLFNLHR